MASRTRNRIAALAAVSAAAVLAGGIALSPTAADTPPPQGAVMSTDDSGQPSVRIPANLAYSYPDREALSFSDTGVTGWSDAKDSIVWYGKLANLGQIRASVTLRLPKGEKSTLRLTIVPGGTENPRLAEGESADVTVEGAGETPVTATFPIRILHRTTGWTRFALSGISKTGAGFGDIANLSLAGPALAGAQFNTTHFRSNASVHLGYHPPADIGPIDAFYNEVTARREPVVTYYCAIGWNRGYMGYQVNGPHERRIIFSVWDAGNEKTDKNAVAQKDRAEWLDHGPGVVTDRFGNEGTGGHSHLVYPWKEGETYRFLVTSKADGPDHIIYAGYFYFPEKKAWGLIGRIRTPAKKSGDSASEASLHGLYSFDEDFSGAAGDKLRSAEFGPQWAHTPDGTWREVTDAHFSNTDRAHKQRDDYDAYPTPNGRAFVLNTGGYVAPHAPIEYGDMLHRKPAGVPPADVASILASEH